MRFPLLGSRNQLFRRDKTLKPATGHLKLDGTRCVRPIDRLTM